MSISASTSSSVLTSTTALGPGEYVDIERQQSDPKASQASAGDPSNNNTDGKYHKISMFNRFLGQFDPYLFIFVMGTGISSDILYSFPYKAYWLRICSYIMFAIASLLFISLQFMFILHIIYFTRKYSTRQYFDKYFRNLSKNVFWGTYPMGLVTIINYLNNLSNHFHVKGHYIVARNMIRLVYVLWWYDIIISVFIAWGVTFIIWQNYYFHDGLGEWKHEFEKMAAEHLRSVLLLAIIPMIVGTACSSLFTMSDLFTLTFNRNIQLLTMVITALIWFHAIIFVFILLFLYFWSLYVFKIPSMSQVFTMFLVLGPMGQGSFGILLLTNNIKLYVDQYYHPTQDNMEYNILLITVPWCFKIFGMIIAMGLLAMGYFFTIISVVAIISYGNERDPTNNKKRQIYRFHQGFWGATFPMGTMSLGSGELFIQYNKFVPFGTFRVISSIYGVVCILWTLYCLINTIILYAKRGYHAYRTQNDMLPIDDEMKLKPTVSQESPETDFSFMREYDERYDGLQHVVSLPPTINPAKLQFDMASLCSHQTCPM